MAELDEKLQGILKNKKILIPAIAIGAIAGLYALSKNSGGGAGGLAPDSPLAPQQPGTGDGGTGYDDAGIIGRLTQIEANQQGFFAQFTQSLQDAIAGVRGENASALQSVIDQVNSQLSSGGAQPGSTVPDFAGFQSQLTAALSGINNIPNRAANTGNILQKVNRESLRGTVLDKTRSGANNPLILNNAFQNALKGRTTVPRQNYTSAISRFFSTATQKVTQTVNRNVGVPRQLGSGYLPYVQGRLTVPKKVTTPVRKVYSGGGGLLRK